MRKAQLPSADILFGKEVASKHQITKSPKRQITKTSRRRGKERLTLYLPSELWEGLQELQGKLYRKYRIKANKSRIISAILEENLQKFEEIARLLQKP